MHYIVIGLGNPRASYSGTRHNIGADALIDIATRHNLEWRKEKKYYQTEYVTEGHTFTLVTPETYMNNIGDIFSYMHYAGTDILVVYDDLDVPFGNIKISFDRSSGGHKGLGSIIDRLGTRAFVRVRLGIIPYRGDMFRKPRGEAEVEKHILGSWNTDEQQALPVLYQKVEDIMHSIATQGLQQTMTTYN